MVEATTCEDMNSGCAAGVGFGYCTGSDLEISFMKKYCQKSCGFCKSATKKCEDKRSSAYCYQIKRLNYCTNAKYKAHFQKYCPATCEFCKCKFSYICLIFFYCWVQKTLKTLLAFERVSQKKYVNISFESQEELQSLSTTVVNLQSAKFL